MHTRSKTHECVQEDQSASMEIQNSQTFDSDKFESSWPKSGIDSAVTPKRGRGRPPKVASNAKGEAGSKRSRSKTSEDNGAEHFSLLKD